jgi:hypothetical protein
LKIFVLEQYSLVISVFLSFKVIINMVDEMRNKAGNRSRD